MANFHISQVCPADRDEKTSTSGHIPVAEAGVKNDEFSDVD